MALALELSLPVDLCGQGGSHADHMACAAARLSEADRKLEIAWSLYGRAMRRVADRPPDGGNYAPSTKEADQQLANRYLKAVDQSRFRFQAFRDAQCLSEGFSMRGGSGSDDPIVACKIKLDDTQTAHLTALTKAIR